MSPTEYEIDPDGLPPRRPTMRQQLRGRGRWFALGFVIAVLIAVGALTIFSRTDEGRARVLVYTLELLGDRLNGRLTVQSVDGNLLTGATLYDVVLSDTTGVALATVDSAYIRYRIATLTGGDIVIGRLEVWGADIYLVRLPGDTLWNYQHILRDPTPSAEPGDSSATLIEELALNETNIKIRLPLEVDSRLPADRQEEELQLILTDTTRYMLDREGDAYMRTTLIDIDSAEVGELFIGPDERGGISFELVDAVSDIRLWMEPPLHVRGIQGELQLRDGIVNYSAPGIQLAASRGESLGVIDLRGERPLYDIYLATSEFTLSDLRWLYPWLPSEPEAGGGSGRLWVKDRDDGLLVVARDVELDMPDTHVTGRFGLIADPAADALRFVDVDLEAEPLRLESVEQLLPEDLPVEGLVIGGATIRGES
jgi:hypothetical protein